MTGQHPLRTWRRWRGVTLGQLKERVELVADAKVSASHLSMIECGKKNPSLALATRLSAATGGEVKVEEFARSQ